MRTVEKLVTDHLDLWTAAIKRKSAAGRGSSSKIELYGITKLRELILDLAVRGLLVPQAPSDEPASELLKKIATEKAKLVKEAKLKKGKPFPPIAELEKPFGLPASWVWQHLVDVFYPISVSKNKVKTSELSEHGKHPVVDQGQSFIAGYVDDDNLLNVLPGPVIVFGDHTSALKYIDFNFVAGADGVKILRPICCDERYFFLVCRMLPIESRGYGRHYSRLIDNLFPLPPLAEQHRIVAKVDELMALCDLLERQTDASLSAHETLVETLLNALTRAADHTRFASAWERISEHFDTLFTTKESIDQLKQTILQLSVVGKLVPQDPSDEPASELLKKIAAEKARLVMEGKIKNAKPLPSIDDDKKPFELPKGWEWARFPELGEFGRGKSKHRPRNDPKLFVPGIYPLVQTGEVARADEVITEYHSKYSDLGLLQSKMWPAGTLCITIAANIADSALLGFDACFPDSVVGFVPFKPLDDARYLLTFMKTARAELLKFAPATAQKNINLEILESVLIPLPPKAEIARISSKVDELTILCDQLKSRLSVAQNIQLHLADALTEKALARI